MRLGLEAEEGDAGELEQGEGVGKEKRRRARNDFG